MLNIEFVSRIVVALTAGLAIGFERQWHHKAAGLRTTTLVALGSALFVLLSVMLTKTNGGDATRIIGQVVTGIGFLCGGVIFKEGFSVHGLTTAATIWCSSAIGCLAAAGYYSETLLATILIVLVNVLLKPIDNWLSKRKSTENS
jgi:putative Mg2+ transporter-C (MgtC) family protein